MAVRRVYLVWTHSLFHQSVRLLLNHPEVEVVGTTSDYENAADEILGYQPDALLIEETAGRQLKQVMDRLGDIPWDLRVVSLNMVDNLVNLVDLKHSLVESAEDLIHLILEE